MSDFLDHKHCPICGRPVESETEEAYIHLYVPTRCEKVKRKTAESEDSQEIIHWCVHCGHLGTNSEDQGRRCIKCLRSTLDNEGIKTKQPIYYSP